MNRFWDVHKIQTLIQREPYQKDSPTRKIGCGMYKLEKFFAVKNCARTRTPRKQNQNQNGMWQFGCVIEAVGLTLLVDILTTTCRNISPI